MEDINTYPEDISPREQQILENEKKQKDILIARKIKADKLARKKKEDEEKKKEKSRNKKSRVLLNYYNSDLLIPVQRSQLIPGNYYVFKYSNYKHCPIPMILYIGSNPNYQTFEGINMQYFSIAERKRVEGYIQSLGLHTKYTASNGIIIKNLDKEERHIYKNTYNSDSIYRYLKKKLRDKIYFYRRYKFNLISSNIYVIPIEAIDRALEIITPVTKFTPYEKKNIQKSKGIFNDVLNKLKSKLKKLFGMNNK